MANPDLRFLDRALYTLLAANADLTGELASYGGAPAIFSGFPVPAGAPLPRLVIGSIVGGGNDDRIDAVGRELVKDIFLYFSADETQASANPIDRIAEIARGTLHNVDIPVSGWNCCGSACGPVIVAPTDENFFVGRTFSVLLKFHATTN